MNSGIRRPPARHEAGFSVVEGLIASLILLVVVLGVLPLVSQSMINNSQGNNSTQESNATIDSLEELFALPFNAPELTVAAGSTSLVTNAYKLVGDEAWTDGVYGGTDTPQLQRIATVELFSVTDLATDGDNVFDTPLDGATLPGSIAFKRLQIRIQSQRVFNTSSYRVTTVQAY